MQKLERQRCHLTGNFGLVEFTRDPHINLKSLHSCPNNGHSLGNEIEYSLCSFFAFLTLPKYNTPCPPFLGHFLLLGRGDHSSSVCVSTSSEKGGSACRCPQYCWKCLSLLVWAFFLHPLLLLSTHADKFTDRVSFLCLGTGSIAVCSGPLFYPLSPLENESLCQKAAWNMMQSLRPQQSLRLYHHMRWRLKRFFIHHKTYSICWTWVDMVMTGGKIYSL